MVYDRVTERLELAHEFLLRAAAEYESHRETTLLKNYLEQATLDLNVAIKILENKPLITPKIGTEIIELPKDSRLSGEILRHKIIDIVEQLHRGIRGIR